MPLLSRHAIYTKVLLRFGQPARALEVISQVLAGSPAPAVELDLRLLEARAAAATGDAKRAHGALKRGFELTDQAEHRARSARRLGYFFNKLARGVVAGLRSIKVGKVRVLLVAGSKGRLRLIGLCTNVEREWAQQPVRLYFDEYMVSETTVLPLQGSGGRGQFEFRIKRSTFTELGANSVSIEVAGVRHVLAAKLFGRHWPKEFRSRASTHPDLTSRLARGYKLDRAGVVVLPKNINEVWLRSVFGLYDRARAWFSANYGYELYPVGGTLLGYARNGEVISFDNDFDTGYLSKHTSPDEIRREYKEIIIRLLQEGVDVQIVTSSNPPRIRRDYLWYGDGKNHIDIFVGAFINGKYRRPTFVDTQLTPDDMFPFKTAKMNGYEILVPKDVEKKVAAVYGPGWRTPDPLWTKVRSPEIIAYREQISLTPEDLLEVAAVSPKEGARIRELVESGALVTS